MAAAVEHQPLLSTLESLGLVVDVGANKGQFALVARHCFPQARIVSFEPLPGPAARFRKVFSSDPRVTLHQVGIAPERNTATMYVSAREDSSSLLPITASQNSIFPGTEAIGTTLVSTGLLKDFIEKQEISRPALLKLDVQGFELEALAGCAELLELFSYVYVECSFVELYAGQALADQVIAWLRVRGFVLSGAYNVSYRDDGTAVQADCLFRHQS